MANRLRSFIESVLFAGLKPDTRATETRRGHWLAPVRERFEKLLSGRAPTDPLYLSNRSWKQRIKSGLAVGILCVVLVAALGWGLTKILPRGEPAAAQAPSRAEMIAKLLPDLEKTLKNHANPDAEVAEVRVVQGDAPRLSGLLTNKTNGTVSIEFVLELTDANGSRLGAVTERVNDVPPRSAVPFDIPLKEPETTFALVREVRALQ